jgi:hypothetical protein
MIEIILATYGDAAVTSVSGGRINVTKEVAGKVSPDRRTISIIVSSVNIGVKDPAIGKNKSLIVNFRIKGVENTITTFDGAMFALSSPLEAPTTPAGYLYSIIGAIWSNSLTAIAVFLYFLSVSMAYNLGGITLGVVSALLPYSTFWFFAPIMLILSALQGDIYWSPPGAPSAPALSGGRRRRRR